MLTVGIIVQLILILIRVAYYTLLERKVLGYIQTRKGPNKPGPLGLLVPFADALKLLTKEINVPINRNKTIFYIVPCVSLLIPLLLCSIYPTMYEVLPFIFSIL